MNLALGIRHDFSPFPHNSLYQKSRFCVQEQKPFLCEIDLNKHMYLQKKLKVYVVKIFERFLNIASWTLF